MNDLEQTFDKVFDKRLDLNSNSFFQDAFRAGKAFSEIQFQKKIKDIVTKLQACKIGCVDNINTIDFLINSFLNQYQGFEQIAIIGAPAKFKSLLKTNLKGVCFSDKIVFFSKRKFIEENFFPFVAEFKRKNINFFISPLTSHDFEAFVNILINHHAIEKSPAGFDFLSDFAFELLIKNGNLRKYLQAKFKCIYFDEKWIDSKFIKIAEFVNNQKEI